MIPGSYTSTTKQASSTISFIGNGGKNVSTGGQTITYHASSASGDFLLLVVQADDADNVSTPSGWTQLMSDSYAPFCRMEIFYKFKTTDTSVYVSDPGDHQTASVLTFRNVNSGDPFAGTRIVDENASGFNNTLTGITTTADGAFVLWVIAHDAPSDSSQASGWTNANITGGAELIDISTDTSWDGGFAAWGGIKTTAGATGDTSVTWGGGVEGVIICTISLRPSE